MTKKTKKSSRSKSKNTLYIFLVVVAIVLVSGIIGSWLYFGQQTQTSGSVVSMSPTAVDERRDRIEAIYDSLKIGPDYQLVEEDVFGAKVLYSWDKGRTYSSSKIYLRSANVDVTAADLRQKIEAAGFTYFDEPYPGAVDKQYHFKSEKGEYIRLSVSSQPRMNAAQESVKKSGKLDDAFFALDPNAGPSHVTIKVNLDDNNE